MISDAHRRAIRAYVFAALNTDLPAEMTALDAAAVGWELQDFPRGAAAYCTLLVVAAVPEGGVERIPATVDDVLEVTHRETFEVTVSVTLRSRRAEDAPSWASDAGLRLRRVLVLRASELAEDLARAGCPILRVGGLRDLSTLRRTSQWESTAQVDLTLRVAPQYVTRPGWAERFSGQVELRPPSADPIVVPFDTDPEA